MKTRYLFLATAALEMGTGLILALRPSLPAALLFGSPLSTAVGLVVGRVAGVALFSLGAACWLARDDEQSRAARGLIVAMLLYNTAVAALLADAALVSKLLGVGLWPASLIHAALAVWCLVCLRIGK